jgi:hypothetical protein
MSNEKPLALGGKDAAVSKAIPWDCTLADERIAFVQDENPHGCGFSSPYLTHIAEKLPNLNEKQLQFFARIELERAQKQLEWNSHYNDHDYYVQAIKEREKNLRRIPREMWKNSDFCLKAVKAQGASLEYVTEKLLTPELILAAVTEDGTSLEYVPKTLLTEDIILAAVRQNGLAVYHVPVFSMTKKIMQEALQQNSNAINCLPEDWKEDGVEYLQITMSIKQ